MYVFLLIWILCGIVAVIIFDKYKCSNEENNNSVILEIIDWALLLTIACVLGPFMLLVLLGKDEKDERTE